MKDKDSKKLTPFARGMILYASIFIIILCVLLIFFNFFLSSYEKSRPMSSINEYLSSVPDRAEIISKGLISKISPDVQSEEEALSVIKETLTDCTAVKNKKESSTAELSYYLEKDETPVEHITLIQGEKDLFGFAPWIVVDEELIEDNIISSKEFTIPDSYSINASQGALGKGHIISEGEEFDMLKGFYESFDSLPTMVTYSTGPYVGEIDITIKDNHGNDITSDFESNGVYCIDNCTPEVKAEVEEFAKDYVQRDVKYRSGATGNISENLHSLLECIEHPSELYTLVNATLQGYGFTAGSSRGDYIQYLNIDHCMDCGDGLYCCDISYQVETVSRHGTTTNSFEYKLMVHRQNDGSLKAIAMSYN